MSNTTSALIQTALALVSLCCVAAVWWPLSDGDRARLWTALCAGFTVGVAAVAWLKWKFSS